MLFAQDLILFCWDVLCIICCSIELFRILLTGVLHYFSRFIYMNALAVNFLLLDILVYIPCAARFLLLVRNVVALFLALDHT